MTLIRLWLVMLLAIVLTGCSPPKKAPSAFTTAMEHHTRGEMTEYRRALERELQANPNNLDARYDLALHLEESGQTDDARNLYSENLQRRWHFPSAINLASLLHRQGDVQQAEQILQQTIHNFPHEATPWYLLAQWSAERQQNEQANADFRQAIAADPHNGFAHLHYGNFLASHGELPVAEQQAQQATDLLPDCAPCWKTYGNILMQAGKGREAVSAYQRSLALSPDPDTRLQLIHSLRAIGEEVRAQHMQDALNALRQNHAHAP